MEPVTKWSPKQVVDWTRGERVVEDPPRSTAREMGRARNQALGCLAPPEGDKANFCRAACAPLSGAPAPSGSFRWGCALYAADGVPIFKPGNSGMAFP